MGWGGGGGISKGQRVDENSQPCHTVSRSGGAKGAGQVTRPAPASQFGKRDGKMSSLAKHFHLTAELRCKRVSNLEKICKSRYHRLSGVVVGGVLCSGICSLMMCRYAAVSMVKRYAEKGLAKRASEVCG